MHVNVGVGLRCVKVANKVIMKQHNYIIMMVAEVVTCVRYLQSKVLRNNESGNKSSNTIMCWLPSRLRSNESGNT